MPQSGNHYDVAIVGGSIVGATVASLLKKYNPDLRVIIIEKEKFPRDHIGESQLPSISPILEEMEVWDEVEAAGFPIKIGGTYTWGRNADKWDFDFYPVEKWRDEPRPAKYEGQRRHTAFQVDRSLYDTILLNKARQWGAEVREETTVAKVHTSQGPNGPRVEGYELENGEMITARYYIDGSGVVGLVRRALGVETDAPKALRNIATWDYWQNTEWAVEIGVGGTRIQVQSLSYGWIWFIPIGPTRTSIGLICPSEYYKNCGKTPEQLYLDALHEQPDVRKLIQNAKRENILQSCKDWSHLARNLIGDNWILAGDTAGFADPILSAGMTLAHSAAREAAYTILEYDRGEIDPNWLRERYNHRNRTNIGQHIRFAQYWYSANSCFTDLKEHCKAIAAEVGLKLSPAEAWRWLSQGGFTAELFSLPALGTFDIACAKQLIELFDERERNAELLCNGHNVFKLNLHGAEQSFMGNLVNGRIEKIPSWRKGSKEIPIVGAYKVIFEVLQATSDGEEMIDLIKKTMGGADEFDRNFRLVRCIQSLEVMIQEGWVLRSKNKKRGMLNVSIKDSKFIRTRSETQRVLQEEGSVGTVKVNV